MLKPRNDARLSPCEAFWQKHNGFLCEKPILPYEHSANEVCFLTFNALMLLFLFLYIINVEKLMRPAVENTLVKLIKKSVIL